MDIESWLSVALFVLLIILSAFFSGSESAFFSFSQIVLQRLREDRRKSRSVKRILKLMRRFDDTDLLNEYFKRIRKSNPNLLLDVHYILGFPTETDEEFKESLDFIINLEVNAGSVYPFSCVHGTDAESIEPKVSDEVINSRLEKAVKYLRKSGYKVSFQKSKEFLSFSKKG